jgi:hypothetical protein
VKSAIDFLPCERKVTKIGETLGKLVALLRSPEGQENALVDRAGRSASSKSIRHRTAERMSAPYEFVTTALALSNPS